MDENFKCTKCGSSEDLVITGIAYERIKYLCDIGAKDGEVTTIDLQHDEVMATFWDDNFKCETCGETYSRSKIAGKPSKIRLPDGGLSYDPVTEQYEISAKGVFGPYVTIRRQEGISVRDTKTIAKVMSQAPSMANALRAIANMKIAEDTNMEELLALCLAMARLEIEKIAAAGGTTGGNAMQSENNMCKKTGESYRKYAQVGELKFRHIDEHKPTTDVCMLVYENENEPYVSTFSNMKAEGRKDYFWLQIPRQINQTRS